MTSETAPGSPGADNTSPQTIAGYRLRKFLGSGPTGEVFSGLHPIHGDKVAIKLFHPVLWHRTELVSAFIADSRRRAAWQQEGVVAIKETGRRTDGTLFQISEFMRGESLHHFLERSNLLTLEQCLSLLKPLALILDGAHQANFAHGDLKPSNIWLSSRGEGVWPPRVQLVDFGVNSLLQPTLASGSGEEFDTLPLDLHYMAPEQCQGETATPASDIYSLGVIIYRLLCGRLPLTATHPRELRHSQIEEEPSWQALANFNPELLAVLKSSLAKDWRFRPPHLRDFISALESAAVKQQSTILPLSYSPKTTAEKDQEIVLPKEVELPRAGTVFTPRVEPNAISDDYPQVMSTTAVLTVPVDVLRRRRLRLFISATLGFTLALMLGATAYYWLGSGRLFRPPKEAVGPGPMLGAKLHIATTPPGATVYLDNREQKERTPLTIGDLQRGVPYDVHVILSGHVTWRQVVAIGLEEHERQLQISLPSGPPKWGTLQLTTNAAADFFLDGRQVAARTDKVVLADVQAEQEHQLRVVANGYAPFQLPVRVEPGKTRLLKIDLIKEPNK